MFGSVGPSLFERSLDTLAHRGPDGSGVWGGGRMPVMLGHRRLSILDTSAGGHQPMEYANYVITYNGEIYNFVELRDELVGLGHRFRSESDTEVLVAAFMQWGHSCMTKFNGMWALAIWNKTDQTLFLARDRFGKKPLFYSFCRFGLMFGSEMKALAPMMDRVEPSRSFKKLAGSVFEYESTSECLLEGIYRFPAGSYAFVSSSDIKRRRVVPVRYWDTREHLTTVPREYNEQVERFRELFVDACRLRMRSDVPIGTALSGGIDSSAVACAMRHLSLDNPNARQANDWQRAFVATFPGSEYDESGYARSVVEHVDATGVFLPIDPTAGMERLNEYLYLFEELYWTSPIPMIDLYGAVREHGVKVTIDGHGADELLSGYDGFLQGLNDCFPDISYAKHILKAFGEPTPSIRSVYQQLVRVHHGNRGLLRFVAQRLANPLRDDSARGTLGYLNAELERCFHRGILPTLLRNYDRYSMANGVEIRMPFLDHRLVSYCFSLPWQSKIPLSSDYTKAILRDAIGPWMPDKVRFRRNKIGFNTPIGEWMKGPWKEFILDTVRSQVFEESTLIDPPAVRAAIESAVFDDVLSHQADRAWASLMPHFWEHAFLKRCQDYRMSCLGC